MKNILIWIVILAAVAVGIGYYLQQQGHFNQASSVQETPLDLPKAQPEPAIAYPVPQPQKETAQQPADNTASNEEAVVPKPPLPSLADSDQMLLKDLSQFIDLKKYQGLFILKSVIQRFVVTVNNLTTENLPRKYLLTRSVQGSFKVKKDDQEHIALDPANYDRYNIYVTLLESIDTDKLVKVYVRFYPLFQEAYESLGYPGKYFNDRLIDVIDNLLDAPQLTGKIVLKQPKVFYQFADPQLESLSAGQKILVRMGPDNAERVKAVLRQLRLELIR